MARLPLLLLLLLPARAKHADPPRHVVVLLVDDLGHAGVQANNPHVRGPHVDALRAEGLSLQRHYVYKYCSPTRGALLTARYPWRLGSMRSNFIPWSRPDGLDLRFTLLPAHLKAARPDTRAHHTGKWHLGFVNASFLPVHRGFDTFFGFLTGAQDHFTERLGFAIQCRDVVDLTENTVPARGRNGTWTGALYNAHAVDVIRNHDASRPLFLNYWLHNTHGPVQVPPDYAERYPEFANDTALQTFYGMVSAVDDAVGNVTRALKETGLWNNTLVIYTHDNGAPLGEGGSNYPLRGGKNGNFEGGVRVPAVVSGGALPAARRGQTSDALVHVSDWGPTILDFVLGGGAGAGAGAAQWPADNASAAGIPVDGMSQWGTILGRDDPKGPRNEIVLDHCKDNFSTSATGCNHYGVSRANGTGALLVGQHMKLVKGPNGGSWSSFTNGTRIKKFSHVACGKSFCLFNVTADPGEHHDLKDELPELAARMLRRFVELNAEYHPPSYNPPPEDAQTCGAAAKAGGFLVPWRTDDEDHDDDASAAPPPQRTTASTSARPHRSPPNWPYNWSTFPAIWFGANVSGMERDVAARLGNYSLLLLGWQDLQTFTNYTELLTAQARQLRQFKDELPDTPTFLYLPVAGVEPYNGEWSRHLFAPLAAAARGSPAPPPPPPSSLPRPSHVYADCLFTGGGGQLFGPSTNHKCAGGVEFPACATTAFNFFNETCRDYFFDKVVGEDLMGRDRSAFDGVFFDASTKFMRQVWAGAANAPATPSAATDATTLAVEAELMRRLVETSARFGKYPMFNSRLSDMNFSATVADTNTSREQVVLGATGDGGLLRYYDTSGGGRALNLAFVDHALAEWSRLMVYTVLAAHAKTRDQLMDQIAVFLLLRQEFWYMGVHASYLDDGWAWHAEFDLPFGTPVDAAAARSSGGGAAAVVTFSRRYTGCNVTVLCNQTAPCRGSVEFAAWGPYSSIEHRRRF